MFHDELFGEVRSVLQETPSARAFRSLAFILGDGNPPRDILDYASSHIARWPAGIPREAPLDWTRALMDGERVAAYPLCDTVEMEVDLELDAFEAWLDAPDMHAITRLRLFEPLEQHEVMDRIVRHPRLANLEELRFESYELGDEELTLLARSKHRSLRVLEFEYFDGGDDGVAALANSEVFAGIERFVASSEYSNINVRAARALADSPHVGALRALSLKDSRLDNDAIVALAHSRHLTNLEELDVGGSRFGDRGFIELGRARFARNLRTLDVSYNSPSEEGMIALLTSTSWARLERLEMDYMEFPDEDGGRADMDAVWSALATAKGLNVLRELHFHCDPTFASYIAHAIGSPTLPPDLVLHTASFEAPGAIRVGDTSTVLLERFTRRFGEGPVEDASAWADALRRAHAIDPDAYDEHWRPVVAKLPKPDMLPTMYGAPDSILPPEVGVRARSDQRGVDALAHNISRRDTFHRLRALDLSESDDAEQWLSGVVSDERMPRLRELRAKIHTHGEELFEEFARGGRHRPMADLTHLELELSGATAENLLLWLHEASDVRLRHLRLEAPGAKGATLTELLRSPALSTLETLELVGWQLDEASILALTKHACAPNLRALRLTPRRALGDALARHVWESGRFESLERLEAWVENADDVSAVGLGRARGLPNLRRLSLDRTSVGDEGLVALMGPGSAHRLEALDCRASVSAEALDRTRGGGWASLSSLDMSYSTLPPDALEVITEAPLGDLALNGVPLGDEGVETIGAILARTRLKRLSVWRTGITSRGVAALAHVPSLRGLEELTLAYNELGDRGLWELSRAPHLRNLRKLDLRRVEFGERGAHALAHAPNLATLRTLATSLKWDDPRLDILSASPVFGEAATIEHIQ